MVTTTRWSPPLAEGDPRGHLHRWRRGRQPTSSSRCRLTPTVTNIRRYLVPRRGAMLQVPLNLALERLLRRFGGSQDGAGLQEIEHAKVVHRRAHHNLRTVELELCFHDRALHDLQGPEHRREAAGRAGRMVARATGDVDSDQQA